MEVKKNEMVKSNHFNPVFYLKGFSKTKRKKKVKKRENYFLYAYDKKNNKVYESNIKNVGCENYLYTQECENYLTLNVEDPAISVINKIRRLEKIDCSDKDILSEYIVVMFARGLEGRDFVYNKLNDTNKESCDNFIKSFELVALNNPEMKNVVQTWIKRVNELLGSEKNQVKYDLYSKNVWNKVIKPDTFKLVLPALKKMTWKFLVSDHCNEFLTSDNPVYFSGFNKQDSIVIFPISNTVLLFASYCVGSNGDYIEISSQDVKKLNRLTAFNAHDCLYKRNEEDWVLTFFNRWTR